LPVADNPFADSRFANSFADSFADSFIDNGCGIFGIFRLK
jgi:hypothetical protein